MTDLVLPWKTSKELPALLKEFPEAMQEGIALAETTIEEQRTWLAEQEAVGQTKNPKRNYLTFKMAHLFSSTSNCAKLNEGNSVFEEIEHRMKSESREKLVDSILCPPLEQLSCIQTFALHSISQAWIDLISNLKIAKFQELESKKNKKKKKKSKKKKTGDELPDNAKDTATQGDKLSSEPTESAINESHLHSAPYGKTIADEDTRCANGSSKSLDRRDINKEIFSLDNAGGQKDPSDYMGLQPLKKEISMPGANPNAKQSSAARKAEFKREKRKALKKKQKNEGTKLKKLVMVVESSSSSFGSCSPLEKASCLSVAGSGVLLDYEDQSLRQKKLQWTGNLIQMQRQTFFDEEEVPQVKDRSASQCLESHPSHVADERSSSLGYNRKVRPILQYGMVIDKQNTDTKKDEAIPLSTETQKKPKKKGSAYKPNQHPKALEGKHSAKDTVHVDTASVKAIKPQKAHALGVTRCVFEERQRMKQANYSTFQAIDMRTNYKRISKQSQNMGSTTENLDSKQNYRRRGTQSTVTDKSSYGQRQTKDRKGVMEKAENSSLLSGITGQDAERLSNSNQLTPNTRMNDQLLLSESLNLASFYDNTPQIYDGFSLLPSDDIFMPQFHFGSPYLSPSREEDKIGLITIPDIVLHHPTVMYLDKHSRDFVVSMKLHSDALEEMRRICKERIELVAKVSFMGTDQLEVKTYGSWDTGLSIPGSDIDLLISTPGVDKEVAIKMLETLEENLRDFRWTKHLKNISSAQIPVLKIKVDAGEPLTKELFPSDVISEAFLERNNVLALAKHQSRSPLLLSVDVIVETPENNALKTTTYVVESCKKWPELRDLVLLMKFFLARKGLTNPYTGIRNSSRRAK